MVPIYLFVSENLQRMPAEVRDRFGPLFLVFGLMRGVTLFQIGRSLLRRERWGAYLTIPLLGLPLVWRVAKGQLMGLNLMDVAPSLAGLVIIATVWKELHPKVEVELEEFEVGAEDEPFTPRNRGYGEGRRALPLETMPATATADTRTPLPTRNPRDH